MWFLELENLQRRHIAYKLRIKDILSSKYVKTDGINPNYLQVSSQEVSRVNAIGVVVQKSNMENYSELIMDDGTGKISARTFENNFLLNNVDVGDVVLVIGRPREYLEEKYLVVEIAKKIDPLWAKARKLELKDFDPQDNDDVKEGGGNKEIFDESRKNRLLKTIKELDKGEGVPVDDLHSALGNVDNIVGVLLREGDVFEVRPGKLKVLE